MERLTFAIVLFFLYQFIFQKLFLRLQTLWNQRENKVREDVYTVNST